MTPRIYPKNMGPLGRRWFIDCPIHSVLERHHLDRELAEAAWNEHLAGHGGAK